MRATPPPRRPDDLLHHSRDEATNLRHCLLFAFLSGVAALIYEIVWIKQFSYCFGSTSWAISTVVGSYLLFMGVGAALYHKIVHESHQNLRTYGLIEAGVALSSVIASIVLSFLPEIYAKLTFGFTSGVLLTSIRFGLTILLLGVPAIMMGATLPALGDAIIRSKSDLRDRFGGLYGLNVLGAATGCAIAGFFLIEHLGCRGSATAAGVINVTVAGLSYRLWMTGRRIPAHQGLKSSQDGWKNTTDGLPGWVPPALLAGSGFCIIAIEVIWFRGLKYLVGNSTYAVSVLLIIFLIGLALGSLLSSRIKSESGLRMRLVQVQTASAVLSVSAVLGIALVLSNDSLWQNLSVFAQGVAMRPWYERLSIGTGLSLLLLLPPAIVMGLSFPLACRAYGLQRSGKQGSIIGRAYLFSNIGCIAGSVFAVHTLLPSLGTIHATFAIAALWGLLALLILLSRSSSRATGSWYAGVGSVALVSLFTLSPGRLEFRGEYDRAADSRVLFWREGELATVKVIEIPRRNVKAMTLDGFGIGMDRSFADPITHKQLLLAHLPIAVVGDCRRTLNIGLGSGTTLAAMSSHSQIEVLDCVEISQDVVKGARLFADGAVLDDPRVRIIVDDAVHFLLGDTATYDAIVSDGKQNPEFSGNAVILSLEFYRAALKRLSPKGVFVQWLPIGYPIESFVIACRTLGSAFPWTSVFYFPPDAILFVASASNLDSLPGSGSFDLQAASDLIPFGIGSHGQLKAFQVYSGKSLVDLLPAGDINTWERPILEFLPFREFDLSSGLQFKRRNLQTVLRLGGEQSMPTGSPHFRSARWIQLGFMELFQSQDATKAKAFFTRARIENPADSMAAQLVRLADRGAGSLFAFPNR